MKRTTDLALSIAMLAFALPIFAACALAIKLDDGGPLFFLQRRVGQNGRPFFIRKFRSMRIGADTLGPAVTPGGDSRITGVGAWLRAFKLDELPQLLNVIRGEMSLVGPRAEQPPYVHRYDQNQRRVLQYRPGIFDPASLQFFGESELLAAVDDPERAYVERIMPHKLRINLDYADRATLATDLLVIACTALQAVGVSWTGRPYLAIPTIPFDVTPSEAVELDLPEYEIRRAA